MKQLMSICFLLTAMAAFAQTTPVKLPIPIPYKELQTRLYADGKIILKDIQFDAAKNTLLLTSEPQIKEISRLLNAYKKMKVYIVVHTDNSCEPEKCLEISQQRAEQVRDMLGNDYMVNWSQMMPKGIGAFAPVTSNATPAGKKLNERVELVLQ